jgi:Fur family transcriptional regulator, ferric uptake regulator
MSARKLKVEKELFYTYLRQNGLKRTHQKDLILETFLSTEGHLSVEDVYSLVKKKDKKVGIVTVFRTLKSLTACGIAREIALGDGLTRFEHSYHHPHHHHIVCTECHKAIEFISPELESIQAEIVRKYHFQAIHHRFQIYGLCEDCREHRPVPAPPSLDTEKIFARDALKMAICMEKRGIEFYREASSRNRDAAGREILARIAEEEEQHLAALQEELDTLNGQERGLEQAPIFLHFDPCDLERLVPDLKQHEVNGEFRLGARRSLELAMMLEESAAGFFKAYAEKFMETRGKKIFEHFAEEERKHYESISRRAANMLVAT